MFLLTIWLIEYDPEFQRGAATRLPIPVLCGHVLFAFAGLGFWVMYLITGKKSYCWTAAGALAVIVTLGLIMAIRWLGVYRAHLIRQPAQTSAMVHALRSEMSAGRASPAIRASKATRWLISRPGPGEHAVPPERHFPVAAVIAHGIFALATATLVVLTLIEAGRG